MDIIRPLVATGLALSLAACASSPTRSTSTGPAATGAAATVPAVDVARVKDAARGLGVRPAFGNCVDAAQGTASATLACIDAELQHQQARIDAALASRRALSTSNGDVAAIQAQWRAERDRVCGADDAGVPAAQRIQAGICRLEATAARADVLAR
ncbi:lysozyme inhibitor LprI family protein [Lysobacter sp. N42]|uniref:lysozyme inhibitor LprI family protein n=1 Tax=Lysobacter sp. N42 TaxID=2545719 RepID=UPI00104F7190|nr:lysozyme inhibitor LprI family protein [Lysobacter sp. N42]TCZ85388.1 DUF1311 domain-containing protein [Lysobacter sp. N42]